MFAVGPSVTILHFVLSSIESIRRWMVECRLLVAIVKKLSMFSGIGGFNNENSNWPVSESVSFFSFFVFFFFFLPSLNSSDWMKKKKKTMMMMKKTKKKNKEIKKTMKE